MVEIRDYPPNIEAIRAVLDIPKYGVVFTYGNQLYNPDGGYIDGPLMVHEEVHERQQLEMGVERWWFCYLLDPEFRTRQEVEAYRAQFSHFCQIERDRNKQIVFLSRIAKDLSSEMYGSVLTYQEALNKIKDGIVQKTRAVQFSKKGSAVEEYTERQGRRDL